MFKGFKVRIYPNKEQIKLIDRYVGCCRFVWNYMIEKQKESYKDGKGYISAYSMNNLLPIIKKENEFLNIVSATTLQRVCRDLDKSYQSFFKKTTNYPKFKARKENKKGYPIGLGKKRFYFLDENVLHIEKLGNIKYKTDQSFPIGIKYTFSNPRLCFEDNKFFVTFQMKCETQALKLNNYNMGIDVGIEKLAAVAYGDRNFFIKNINKDKKIIQLERQIKTLQKSIQRKYFKNKNENVYLKTNNIRKQEEKVRKLYKRISGIRRNYIEQTTKQIIDLKPQRIVVEHNFVKNLSKNKKVAKSLYDVSLYLFKKRLKEKCENNEIPFVQASHMFASTKICSKCGERKERMSISTRTYNCKKCGLSLNRDTNAAINLMNY